MSQANRQVAEKIVHSILGKYVRRGDILIGDIHQALNQKDAEIEKLQGALAQERERCAQVADSMNSVSNIGDRIRYGLGHERKADETQL